MIVDANVLLRASIGDDPIQSPEARRAMAGAEHLFISNTALCEFVWVVGRKYKESRADSAMSIRALLSDQRTVVDRDAVEAGLAFLDAGGDFC